MTRILIVEDNPVDADLMEREMRKAGLEFRLERVVTEADYLRALHEFAPDVILSDHSLPTFDAKDAVRIALRERPGTPVIVVTGRLDDEVAVEYLKAGAADYILKHKLMRLGPAVRRALELRQVKQDHSSTEEARKLLESQLIQSQKMESIGRLAGGVAHDFNNLLTIILGESELALEDVDDKSPVRESLEQIRKAGQQAAELTRQLLSMSRRQVVEPKVFRFEDLVQDTDKMLRRLIGADIQLECRLSDKPGSVKADRGQIGQVLVNLAVNARDAMPNGGMLTVETDRIFLDADYANTRADVTPGDYVSLAVSDTGTGMTQEVMTRIFEPFFTTKEAGRGTGLGLATCYGIVKQAGGHIVIYSEVGRGTTMRVYIPEVREADSAAAVPAEVPTAKGTETILLVEDQMAVRDLGARMLRGHGYRVITASTGEEALRLLADVGKSIQLLLTDVVLPDINGGELADRARAELPQLKVLFASGYTADVVSYHKLLEKNAALLQKPFTGAALGRKVREVLDYR